MWVIYRYFIALPALEVPKPEGYRSLRNKKIGSISEKAVLPPWLIGYFDSRAPKKRLPADWRRWVKG